MINLKRTPAEPTPLDEEIDRLHRSLVKCSPSSDDYDAMSNQLAKLYKLREEISSKKRVSSDVMVRAGAELVGILLVLQYERAHVMTSKAFGLVGKLIK